MWWKIYFWITIVELVLQLLGLFVNPGIRIATQIAVMVIFAIAVVGMYAFAFQKKFGTQLFWQYFTWIYALLDLVYLVYAAAPTAPVLSSLSFLQIYPDQTFLEVLFGVAIDIPLVYAMYRLTKDEPYPKKKEVTAKDEPFRWGMMQTAVWGYSVVLVLYLFIIGLLPADTSSVAKQEASDPTYIVGMFAPLVLFWLWVAVQYKKYQWNWWRTTLALNGLFYSGLILWDIFFPQEASVQTNVGGVDVIGLLQLGILFLGLWVFGKTQFTKKGVK